MYPAASGDFVYNQNLYFYGMKISQYCGTTLNVFTIFIIQKYSNVEMGDYKNHLIVYQVRNYFSIKENCRLPHRWLISEWIHWLSQCFSIRIVQELHKDGWGCIWDSIPLLFLWVLKLQFYCCCKDALTILFSQI